jgi:hypothetical protein
VGEVEPGKVIPRILRPTWEQQVREQGYWSPPFHDLPPRGPGDSTCCVGCMGGSNPRCCRHELHQLAKFKTNGCAADGAKRNRPSLLARLFRRNISEQG